MKTEVSAKLLLASKNEATKDILYTWELTFPRIILAEVNTHRKASRNTSSSRAISIKKLREKVRFDPFTPVSIGQNQRGMQAGSELTGWRRWAAVAVWRGARYPALAANWLLEKLGAHKQVANRLCEPWMWVVQCFSMTDVNNLLLLRNHPDAEPHFHELARQMQAQVEWCRSCSSHYTSNPLLNIERYQTLAPGEWHLPYVFGKDTLLHTEEQITVSQARCANTSYTMPGETRMIGLEQAKSIAHKLFGGDIKHLSPCEHQAMAMAERDGITHYANFRGFRQRRATIPGEKGGD